MASIGFVLARIAVVAAFACRQTAIPVGGGGNGVLTAAQARAALTVSLSSDLEQRLPHWLDDRRPAANGHREGHR